jgi:hypothetical protein
MCRLETKPRAVKLTTSASLSETALLWPYDQNSLNTTPGKETAMPFYEKGDVRIHYEEADRIPLALRHIHSFLRSNQPPA